MQHSVGRMPGLASTRLAVSAAVGVGGACATGLIGEWLYAPSIGWDMAAAVFLGWTGSAIIGMDATATEAHATVEDPTSRATQVIVLAASLASLVGVGMLIARAGDLNGGGQVVVASLGVASIALSWFVVHTLFTLRYALIYYDPDQGGTAGEIGGIDFGPSAPPSYSDFAYLAFTIGMTFQVSDTQVGTPELRSTVLRHALLSYLFGALILAATVNLLVSLATPRS
jgi:uncharacterized membrane protein